MNRVEELIEELLPYRKQLAEHPVLDRIDDLSSLRIFMKSHVFAVWDFMTLLKSMQRQLTSTDVLWRPSSQPPHSAPSSVRSSMMSLSRGFSIPLGCISDG